MSVVSPLILLHPDDNVLVLRRAVLAGELLALDGGDVPAPANLALGHKVARRVLHTGEPVVKYGARIGSMTADAPAGAHVHGHNMRSDYIGAHSRDAAGPEGGA